MPKIRFKFLKENFKKKPHNFNPDLIICNDVFEHILDPVSFSKDVYAALDNGGIFGIATTSSDLAISIGDISMMHHQHVNMFTSESIRKILEKAGFEFISVNKSEYGDTFHITAQKNSLNGINSLGKSSVKNITASLDNYLRKAHENVEKFKLFYDKYSSDLGCYVPLRCFPYLSCVGDYGKCRIFDGNKSWENLYFDGYSQPIENIEKKSKEDLPKYFYVGSISFYDQIKTTLLNKGIKEKIYLI